MFFSNNMSQFQNIKHCFFSKNKGFSKGIYKSLNCGLGSNDKSEDIIKNLKFVAKSMGVNLENLKLMNQTHSSKVVIIDKNNQNLNKFDSDALVTKLQNIAIGVLTADCVPVFLYDKKNKIIACLHAGWRGAKNGIIENTVNKIRSMEENNNIIASIGPCIGKNSYEVDSDFYNNFLKESDYNKLYFSKKNNFKFLFNLRLYVESKLKKCDIVDIDNIDEDTYQDSDNFFSYRRSVTLKELDYGRCVSTICLKT